MSCCCACIECRCLLSGVVECALSVSVRSSVRAFWCCWLGLLSGCSVHVLARSMLCGRRRARGPMCPPGLLCCRILGRLPCVGGQEAPPGGTQSLAPCATSALCYCSPLAFVGLSAGLAVALSTLGEPQAVSPCTSAVPHVAPPLSPANGWQAPISASCLVPVLTDGVSHLFITVVVLL